MLVHARCNLCSGLDVSHAGKSFTAPPLFFSDIPFAKSSDDGERRSEIEQSARCLTLQHALTDGLHGVELTRQSKTANTMMDCIIASILALNFYRNW